MERGTERLAAHLLAPLPPPPQPQLLLWLVRQWVVGRMPAATTKGNAGELGAAGGWSTWVQHEGAAGGWSTSVHQVPLHTHRHSWGWVEGSLHGQVQQPSCHPHNSPLPSCTPPPLLVPLLPVKGGWPLKLRQPQSEVGAAALDGRLVLVALSALEEAPPGELIAWALPQLTSLREQQRRGGGVASVEVGGAEPN